MSLVRRDFTRLLLMALITPAGASFAARTPPADVQTLLFQRNDWVPNNPTLPVLVYKQAIAVQDGDPAPLFEQTFNHNGWPPQWRYGVFDYHHYHLKGHEVLGVYRGQARLMLGGPGGQEVEVRAGDVLLLPAGTGHCNLGSSADFSVVGAYPPGQQGDINRQAASPEQLAAIADLPFPHSDPVLGTAGGVMRYWLKAPA